MPTSIFLTCTFAVGVMMVCTWLLSIPLRNVSIVDIGWGLGFVLIAWVSFSRSPYRPADVLATDYVMPVLVTIWGCRLAGYLAWRNHGKPEDYRYQAMRDARGPSFVWSSFLIVFVLQGVVMLIVSLPVQLAVTRSAVPYFYLVGAGVAVWAMGVFFETVGDWQLARFKAQPENKGRVMNRGLWRLTRHPNYFGDFLVWWGLWLVSMGLSDRAATWWSVISPALMSFLLIRVSGVALLEKSMKARSPEYVTYIEQTSAFIPWPPKKV